MGAFLYYTLHSFKNAIKKLFKTWIIIFLAVFIIFGAIGFIIGNTVDDISEEPSEIEEVDDEIDLTPEEVLILIENICGVAVILILAFTSMNANKSGSAIFTEADVDLLFASPIKPQKILSFKLTSKLLSFIFAGIYMLFYIPNWLGDYATVFSVFGVMLIFIFALMFAQLFQSILYLLSTNNYLFSNFITPITIGIPIVIFALFGIFYLQNDYTLFQTVDLFFNSNIYRSIPIIGSLKVLLMSTINVNVKAFFKLLALNLGYFIILSLVVSNIHADFYEDAMAKSQETAELLRDAEIGVIHRKKDRPDKIVRNNFKYGEGANVYFFKEMYNRFRFATFHFLTKTLTTYLILGVGASIFSEKVISEGTGLIASIIVITAVAFYRSLGNGLSKDVTKPFFILIPEKASKKLFYSLISGTTNCLLDILPAYLISTIIFKGKFLLLLTGVLLTISMDYYSSAVGCFVDLTVEGKGVSNPIKVMVQLMFIYLGLAPNAVIIIVLAVVLKISNGLVIGFILSSIFNILIGTIFFFLCPRFLEPKIGRRGVNKEYQYK